MPKKNSKSVISKKDVLTLNSIIQAKSSRLSYLELENAKLITQVKKLDFANRCFPYVCSI